VPLRSWTYIGVGIAALAFLYGSFIIFRTLLFGNPVLGYASLISVTLFIGGIELIGIGVVGEYIGRIYDESKQRPVYLIRRRYQAHGKVIELPVARDARRQIARRRVQLPSRARIDVR